MVNVSKYEQTLDGGMAKICILLASPEIKYPNDIMRYAVSCVVGNTMYNEMIDISLQRPYLRLVLLGDINLLNWKKNPKYGDSEFVEIELKNGNITVGKVVFMRGGFYQKDPNKYMSNIVQQYLNDLGNTNGNIHYEAYNELVEEPLDNPWFRVLLLNINKIIFEPYI